LAIAILDHPEPVTDADRSGRPVLIESDAYHQLLHELRRYCQGTINGRSFLIAGHRGAGKTTLVLSALQAIDQEYKQQIAVQTTDVRQEPFYVLPMRPLLVQLQGPSMLPKSSEKSESAAGEKEGAHQFGAMENVLVQITLGLHRAAARRFAQEFRVNLLRKYELQNRHSGIREVHRVDLELAAQFELDLDEYPGKSRLREYWRRAGALGRGVLFGRGRYADQGLRELVALCSISEAYRRISGTLNRTQATKTDVERRNAVELALDLKGKDFYGPLIALLTGGSIGAGAMAVGSKPELAVLAGALTALLSAFSGKVSAGRSYHRSLSQEDLFVPDLSVATLDRVLPVLIRRLREAGLAPVFVVDELDKVEDLSSRITEVVGRFKKLVTESACFCFLTDRRYFEEMRQRTASAPYSTEYTYFSNQIFVTFRHQELHNYLAKVLNKPEIPSSTTPSDAVPGAPAAYMERREANQRTAEELDDFSVLPYILLHAAQMHPIDLWREIMGLRGPDGNVVLTPGAFRSGPRYNLELLIQVAVELVLEEENMQRELERQPAFRRLAHDAVYYPSRCWDRAEEELVIGEKGEQNFSNYLVQRMTGTAPEDNEVNESLAIIDLDPMALAAKQQNNSVSINPIDRQFLWNSVLQLAELLAKPDKILKQAEKKRLPAIILEVLRTAIELGPFLEPVKRRNRIEAYRWRFHRSGRLLRTAAAPSPLRQIEMIRKFEVALTEISSGLIDPSTMSSLLGIMPRSPAWPAVKRAVERLQENVGMTVYPQRESDISTVDSYCNLIKRSIEAVGLALYNGCFIGTWNRASLSVAARLSAGLAVISRAYNLLEIPDESALNLLWNLASNLPFGLSIKKETASHLMIDRFESIDGWTTAIRELIEKASNAGSEEERTKFLAEAEPRVWSSWLNDLLGRGVSPALEYLVCAVALAGPFSIFKLPPASTTLLDWSLALIRAVFPEESPPFRFVPGWIVVIALERLGFGAQLQVLVEKLEKILEPRKIAQDEADLIRKLAFDIGDRRRAGALIINAEGASSDTWQPSAEKAGIVVRERQLKVFEELTRRIPLTEWIDWLVFDLTAEKGGIHSRPLGQEHPILSQLEEWRSEFMVFWERDEDELERADGPRLAVVVPENWSLKAFPNEFAGYRIAVAPSSLNALFEQLERSR
jgi:hypothetical protein